MISWRRSRTAKMPSDFGRKWTSDSQPSGCGSCPKTAMLPFDGSLLHGGLGRPVEKPGTFTFLGFTHYLAKTRRGTITIGRTPSVKARERFVRKVTTWVKANRHQPVRAHQAHLTKMLNGYYQYFGLYFWTQRRIVRPLTSMPRSAKRPAMRSAAAPNCK